MADKHGQRNCCWMGPNSETCPNDALWQIVEGPTIDDYTESCTDHVGVLLTDAVETRIYPIATLHLTSGPDAPLIKITCPNCGVDHTDRGQLAASIVCSCGHQFSFVRPGR